MTTLLFTVFYRNSLLWTYLFLPRVHPVSLAYLPSLMTNYECKCTVFGCQFNAMLAYPLNISAHHSYLIISVFLMSSKRFILCLLAMIAFACRVLAMNYLIEFRNSTFLRASKHHSHSNGDEVQRERIICGFFTMILFCYCNDAFHICMFRFSNCTCQAPRTQTTAEILTVRIE